MGRKENTMVASNRDEKKEGTHEAARSNTAGGRGSLVKVEFGERQKGGKRTLKAHKHDRRSARGSP